jgi:hypothetical protein
MGWMIRESNPNSGKRFFSLKPTDVLWNLCSLQCVPGIFSGVNLTGLDVYNSSPSSDEVKNEWSYTSTPSEYLHSLDKDILYLSLDLEVVSFLL